MSAPADSTTNVGEVVIDSGSKRSNEQTGNSNVVDSQEEAHPPNSTFDAEKVDASSSGQAEKEEHSAVPGSEKDASKIPEKETEAESTTGRPNKDRSDSIMAIGPAVDDVKDLTPGEPDDSPVCTITLLLTTGSRHPYKIDAKYLARRNVSVPEETDDGRPDPFSISIYTLKELILREWRSDWEAKPPSPTSIRLIHFGKLLDDKEPLKKYQFSQENPNVVHMSVRPQDLDEEEPRSGGKHAAGGGGDGSRSRGSGCCVIL